MLVLWYPCAAEKGSGEVTCDGGSTGLVNKTNGANAGHTTVCVPVRERLKENLDWFKERVGAGISYDVQVHEFAVGGRPAALLWIDGLIKDVVTSRVIQELQDAPSDLGPDPLGELRRHHIPHVELTVVETLDEVVDQVLAGPMALLLDGVKSALILDLRQYPGRSIAEPDTERVTRGSRDGFVETLIHNSALIRRRIRDPKLRFEHITVGTRSKTDVVIGYIDDIVNNRYLNAVRDRLKAIQTDHLAMGIKTLNEFLHPSRFNPLPTVRFTERPDVAAVHLLEGHIVILVDGNPTVAIVPANVWHFTQHAEEFFQLPVVGTYLRWVRFGGFLLSLLLVPLWLWLVKTKPILPSWLQFIGPEKTGPIPIPLQLLLVEGSMDLIRLALVHTPTALATSIGVVGGILLGQVAVSVGLINAETMLYPAIAAIGRFAIPNVEFAMAMRLFNLLFLLCTWIGSGPGLLMSILFAMVVLWRTRSLGLPYLWPLLPWDGKALARVLFRFPVLDIKTRPAFTSPPKIRIRRWAPETLEKGATELPGKELGATGNSAGASSHAKTNGYLDSRRPRRR